MVESHTKGLLLHSSVKYLMKSICFYLLFLLIIFYIVSPWYSINLIPILCIYLIPLLIIQSDVIQSLSWVLSWAPTFIVVPQFRQRGEPSLSFSLYHCQPISKQTVTIAGTKKKTQYWFFCISIVYAFIWI